MKHANHNFLFWAAPVLWILVFCLTAFAGPLERYEALEAKFSALITSYRSEASRARGESSISLEQMRGALNHLQSVLNVSGRERRRFLRGITDKYPSEEALSVPLDVLEVFLFFAGTVMEAHGKQYRDEEILNFAASATERAFKGRRWEIPDTYQLDPNSSLGNALAWRRSITGGTTGLSNAQAFESLVKSLGDGKLPI